MLLWALKPDNPYGYYALLRFVCCAVFTFLTFKAIAQRKEGWAWVFGVAAAVYNPFFPVSLSRDLWTIVNLFTVGLAIASIFVLKVSTIEEG